MALAAGAKRLMDVEEIVRWACASELPKKHPHSSRFLPPLGISRRDGELVGRWTRPPGFPQISPMFARGFASPGAPARGGEPDPDALIIEAAILGLSEPLSLLDPPAGLLDGVGLEVDLAGAFAAAAANVVNLVLAHGRLGNRPALGDDRFSVHPKLAGNSKPGVWRIEQRFADTLDGSRIPVDYEQPVERIRRDLYPVGAYCRLAYEPDPQLVVNNRAEYCVWRLALGELAAALSGALARITPLPPAAVLFPWRGDRDGDSPRNLFGPGAERVHRPAEAAALASCRAIAGRRPIQPGEKRPRRPARPARGVAEG